MPGVSKKTPLPHWQRVMDSAGWLTAADMSRATGIGHGHVHEIIHGKITPTTETILRIARAAEMNAEDIATSVIRHSVAINLNSSHGAVR